jgi:hypothetical protein
MHDLDSRQELLVPDIVAQCEGVVAWGGFFGVSFHISHFEIAVPRQTAVRPRTGHTGCANP